MKTIYVGNVSFRTKEEDLRSLFGEYGTVHNVNFIMDRETGKFRGFCFVEMDDSEALDAIENLNGKEVGGRALKVNEAKERERSSAPRERRNNYRQQR